MTPRERTDVRRLPEKQVRDVAVLHAILDEALQAAVGFQVDGQPYVIPMACARDGDSLLLHGSTGSRLMRALASGGPALRERHPPRRPRLRALCLRVEHALPQRDRPRRATAVAGAEEVLHALEVLTEHLLPGRWAELRAPRAKELAATSVLRVPLDEWSVKVGDGFPEDPDEDLDEPVWAGVVPMRVAYDDPVDAPDLGPGRPVPPHVLARVTPPR